MLSFDNAFQQTLTHISPLDSEQVELVQATGRIAAADLLAQVNSPSVDVSLKDGYAIQSADIADAAPQNPVHLQLVGTVAAGGDWAGEVVSGTAVRILSGAPIPRGAQAVVASEFADDDGQRVTVVNSSEPGRNILPQGSDVALGQPLVSGGTVLRPTVVGFLAAAGHARLPVTRQPRVAIIATGDEVVAPGAPLKEGKLYASNLVNLAAWCARYGMTPTTAVVKDDEQSIRAKLQECIVAHDAIITSGGAWKGDRDLVVRLLDELGWQKIYHRVRIGPGKAVGFGLYEHKPVFCLPGGPPSNHMAFIQLALPGLQKLGGYRNPGLSALEARLAAPVKGQSSWTQFIHGQWADHGDGLSIQPVKFKSRLQMMAQTDGIIMIPEGTDHISAGTTVPVQVLAWPERRINSAA